MRRTAALALSVTLGLLVGGCGAEDPTVQEPPGDEADGALDGTVDGTDADQPTDDGDVVTDDPVDEGDLEAATEAAVADLAEHAGVDPDRIEVVTAEAVTWSDGSLGCPQPDQMYTQALVPGRRVVLAIDGEEFHYHGGRDGALSRCDDPIPPADAG